MNIIYFKADRKIRKAIYSILLFLTSLVCVYYLQGYVLASAILFILLSVYFAVIENTKSNIRAISYKDDYFKVMFDNEDSHFWELQRKIVINGWIYMYLKQEVTNKKIKVWLHKSNYIDANSIRILGKKLNIN